MHGSGIRMKYEKIYWFRKEAYKEDDDKTYFRNYLAWENNWGYIGENLFDKGKMALKLGCEISFISNITKYTLLDSDWT